MILAVNLRSAICVINDYPVLVDADLAVGEGELVAVGGSNGAGKTTLLRVIAGLTSLRSGSCEVFGLDVGANARILRRRFTYLGHTPSLYDELTLLENVQLAAQCLGKSVESAEPALARVGLHSRESRVPAKQASSGQRRRASLAVMLVRDSALWLLDEPLAGLDSEGKSLVVDLVEEARSQARTVILTTHEDLFSGIVDKEVEVRNGIVEQAVLRVS